MAGPYSIVAGEDDVKWAGGKVDLSQFDWSGGTRKSKVGIEIGREMRNENKLLD